jgi:hypothetical protein
VSLRADLSAVEARMCLRVDLLLLQVLLPAESVLRQDCCYRLYLSLRLRLSNFLTELLLQPAFRYYRY